MVRGKPPVPPPKTERGRRKGALGIAREDLAHHRVLRARVRIMIGIVLCRSQIDVVELLNPFAAKERVVQFAIAIIISEIDSKGVLLTVRTATMATTNAQARIPMKAFFPTGRVDEFDGNRPFPISTTITGIGVDTFFAIQLF